MIKTDARVMQWSQSEVEIEVTPERREFLAQKGRRLYGKYCGLNGEGICAESFAEYHIWRGELVVARDFLVFLNLQAEMLRQLSLTDPAFEAQLHITERLIARITHLLGEDSEQRLISSVKTVIV
jgi:hypothetical protein